MDNWKPAVIAAVVVGVIGVGAGVLVGGGGGGETTTTTVVDPVDTTQTTDEPTTDETTTTDDTTTDDTTTPDGPLPVATAFSEADLRANQGDLTDQCVQSGGSEIRGLGGEPLTDPTVLEILYSDRTYCEAWRLELPVSEYSNLEIGRLGWGDNVPAEVTAEFSIYDDTIGSDPLFTDTLTGPSDIASVSLDLTDTDTLILEWKPGQPLSDEIVENILYRFILDEAYVS